MSRLFTCEGPIALSRRNFLKASAILTFAALPELSFGAEPSPSRLLVILLRGGLDGLYAAPPIGDKTLASLRHHVNPDHVLKLDGFFGLHPALANMQKLYQQGQMLLVHGASLPYTGRSHFEGQDIMESGVATAYTSKSGWLGRALDLQGYPSVAMSLPVPLIMRGSAARDSQYPTWIKSLPATFYEALAPLWAADPDLAQVGAQLDDDRADLSMPPPIYVGDRNSLESLARSAGERLKTGLGPRLAVLDHLGFDSHANELSETTQAMKELDDAIGAFRQAIGDEVWKDTLVVTLTEFGRTAAENGSFGTDHGWGTSIFVMGGKLKKAGVVADWPGLKPKDLFEGRDLMATLDARSLYGKIVTSALGIDPDLVRQRVLDHQATDIFDAYL